MPSTLSRRRTAFLRRRASSYRSLSLEGGSCGRAARSVPGGYISLAHCARTLLQVRALCSPLCPVVGWLGEGVIYAQGGRERTEGAAATYLSPCASLRTRRPSKSGQVVWIRAEHAIQTLLGVPATSWVVVPEEGSRSSEVGQAASMAAGWGAPGRNEEGTCTSDVQWTSLAHVKEQERPPLS